ncbi:MAG: entericidin A/B family lipoprotein [Geminicoccaceae bacterium]
MISLTFLLATSGCNTIKGAGEDVQAAGSAVSGTAQKTEDKMEESTE